MSKNKKSITRVVNVIVQFRGSEFLVKTFRKKVLDIHFIRMVKLTPLVNFVYSKGFKLPAPPARMSLHEIYRMNLITRPDFLRAVEKVLLKKGKG